MIIPLEELAFCYSPTSHDSLVNSIERNHRRNPTPINILPDELLLRIFSILIGGDAVNCDRWDGKRLWSHDKRICQDWTYHAATISRVNTPWRRLVIDTASFWSHIELFFEHGYWLALSGACRRCLARVKDAPIELHINCGQMQRFYTAAIVIPSYLRGLTVTSLIVTTSYPAVVQPIVSTYLSETMCSSLNKLQVEFISSKQSIVCVPPPEVTNQQQLFDNFLRLNTLRLSGASMSWKDTRFSGLVELQLCNIKPSPSMDQIYDILATSSELCTVDIELLHLASYVLTGSRSKVRVKLPRLTYLHLGGRVYDFVGCLLQVIESGIAPLCLKLSILEGSSTELESLRIQYNISILSLRVPVLPVALLDRILSPHEYLTTLVLTDQCVDDFCVVPNETHPQNGCLQRIVLRRCRITFAAMHHIASIYSIHSLWLEGCMYTSRTNEALSPELPEAELGWLKETVPDLYIDYVHCRQMRSSLPWWLG